MPKKQKRPATFLSIHDLTRRSTGLWGYWLSLWGLSIHDLTRRSTLQQVSVYACYWTFNSRPHKEVDSNFLQDFVKIDIIKHYYDQITDVFYFLYFDFSPLQLLFSEISGANPWAFSVHSISAL